MSAKLVFSKLTLTLNTPFPSKKTWKKSEIYKNLLKCGLSWNFVPTKFSFEHPLKIWTYFVNMIRIMGILSSIIHMIIF